MRKKAAMFGLDARIALAIFGALSVIAGASLYSSLRHTKAVALIADLEEIGKAFDQYYFDVHYEVPPIDEAGTLEQQHKLKIDYLIEDNGLKGWKGPYISHDKYSEVSVGVLKYNKFDKIAAYKLKEDCTGGCYCIAGSDCFLTLHVTGITDTNFLKYVDEMVDGSVGEDGKIRTELAVGKINYKYRTIRNPHD